MLLAVQEHMDWIVLTNMASSRRLQFDFEASEKFTFPFPVRDTVCKVYSSKRCHLFKQQAAKSYTVCVAMVHS